MEIHHSIADWNYSKILIFLEILKIQNQAREVFCVSLDERSTSEDT